MLILSGILDYWVYLCCNTPVTQHWSDGERIKIRRRIRKCFLIFGRIICQLQSEVCPVVSEVCPVVSDVSPNYVRNSPATDYWQLWKESPMCVRCVSEVCPICVRCMSDVVRSVSDVVRCVSDLYPEMYKKFQNICYILHNPVFQSDQYLSLIHIWRCRRSYA